MKSRSVASGVWVLVAQHCKRSPSMPHYQQFARSSVRELKSSHTAHTVLEGASVLKNSLTRPVTYKSTLKVTIWELLEPSMHPIDVPGSSFPTASGVLGSLLARGLLGDYGVRFSAAWQSSPEQSLSASRRLCRLERRLWLAVSTRLCSSYGSFRRS